MIDFDGNLYLTVDSLIETNNKITGSNNTTLRKVDVKPSGFDRMYIEKRFNYYYYFFFIVGKLEKGPNIGYKLIEANRSKNRSIQLK